MIQNKKKKSRPGGAGLTIDGENSHVYPLPLVLIVLLQLGRLIRAAHAFPNFITLLERGAVDFLGLIIIEKK